MKNQNFTFERQHHSAFSYQKREEAHPSPTKQPQSSLIGTQFPYKLVQWLSCHIREVSELSKTLATVHSHISRHVYLCDGGGNTVDMV